MIDVKVKTYYFLIVSFLLLFTSVPQVFAEWAQDGGNAQRTGYSPEEPVAPWTYRWSFNGPDSSGGRQNHIYDAPKEARTVVGGGKLFVPAGIRGLYGLQLSNGGQLYNVFPSTFNATPAYDKTTNTLLIGGADGKVYKINPDTGATLATYTAGSPVNKAVLLVGNFVYAVSDNGQLHKIRVSDMSGVWVYTGNATVATPPSYSSSRDVLIYATDDLYVHAVNNSDGSQKWRVKPTPNTPGDPGRSGTTLGGTSYGNQFDLGWPVVADKNGIVFVRMQLQHQAIFEGPNAGRFADTNAENRTWLQQNPQWKNLFALNLDNGSEKFVPAVGYGSTEDYTGTEAYGVTGSQPVVKVLPNGQEVAYIIFRNLQGNSSDFRWSGHMGEMVLNDTTIPGLTAGDLRFVSMPSGQVRIIDEENPITIGGNALFHNHWSALTGVLITDRTNARGLSFADPIQTTTYQPIIRALFDCGNRNTTTHFSNCGGLQYVTDGGGSGGRFYNGPGFWVYWNVADPPGWRIGSNNSAGTAYSAGFLPRYSYVTDGYLIVEGNGGDITVLQHNGPVVNPSPTSAVTPTPTSGPILGSGDANNDGIVNSADIILILQNFLASLTTIVDQFGDGRINALDFAQVVAQMPAPTNTPTPSVTNTPTPTVVGPTPTKPPPAAFPVQTGFNDNIPHQIVRTNTNKLYLFAGLAEGSTTLKAYWTNTQGFPSTGADFSGTAQTTAPAAIISVDAFYDGGNVIHVLFNTQGGHLISTPFDITTNTFKAQKTLATGNPTRTCNSDPCYLGTQGVTGMIDAGNTLHIVYRAQSDQIMHKAYTYNASTDALNLVSGPTRIDAQGSANHPAIAISPLDNSLTISWISQAGSPQILARTRSASGGLGSIETVNNSALGGVWVSSSYGVNIDQGPSLVIGNDGRKHLVYMENFDSSGDYGRMHYVTQAPGTNTWSDSETAFYSHAAAVAISSVGDLSIIGHGHPSNASCKSMQDMCAITRSSGSATWQTPQLILAHSGSDHFDASVSVKWSVVGWNRPDVVEFLFFRANGGSYQDTTIMYGRY